MAADHPPRISIGMPVFNRAATVGRAIESVLGQSLTDVELIVSDNASTDDTDAVCRQYARWDRRVRSTRHPAPISGYENFKFVLDEARAPHFMWLPADDYGLPGLLAAAVDVLERRNDIVCCVPRIDFLETDGTRRPAAGTFPLLGTFDENLCRFLADPQDNSRFYGLFRREVLQRVMPASEYYAFDWTVSVGTLLAGRHHELPEVLLVREANDPLKYMRLIDACFPTPLGRLTPLLPFTRALVFELRAPLSVRAWYLLLRLNVIHHVMYCRYRYPGYGRAAHRVGAGLERATAAVFRGARIPGGGAGEA